MSIAEKLKPILYFDTVKLVTVHSVKLGAVHRGIQFAVILYIFIYSIWLQQGYQEYSALNGVLYSKVKGAAFTNDTTTGNITYYDNNDLVIPPLEANAIFILTAFVTTYQTRGTCVGSSNKCKSDSDCPTNQFTPLGIVLPECNTTAGYCMVEGWCPLEIDDNANFTTYLQGMGTSDWTIFLRSSVNYFSFDVEETEPTDPVTSPTGQDLFVLANMIPGNLNLCFQQGCIVNVDIDWTCNLDLGNCAPTTTFTLSPGGFNYRTVTYNLDQTERLLEKFYGVRFLIQITGTGGRFSFFRMIITIGSGAAFFTLATVITDFILLVVFTDKTHFSKKKYAHFALKEMGNGESKEEEQ